MSADDEHWVDECWIEDGDGQRVFQVDGTDLRLHGTLTVADPEGRELATISRGVPWRGDRVEIRYPDGHRVALRQRVPGAHLRERWMVRITDGPELEVRGDVDDHEYALLDGGSRVATVSKGSSGDGTSIEVAIAPHHDLVLLLAAAVAVDSSADG